MLKLLSLKPGLILAVSTLLLCSFTSISPIKQEEPVHVTLHVDTSQITSRNASSFCTFGQEDGVSNEEYTIYVSVGDVVLWEGVSSSAPDTDIVNITSINYQGGKNVFDRNVLQGDGGSPGRVRGTVVAEAPESNKYKYTIKFTVSNNGTKRGGTFQIDPKIQTH
jgi:hypothetical protein